MSEEHLVYFVYETLSKPHTSFLIEALFHSVIISLIINFNVNFNIAVLKRFVFICYICSIFTIFYVVGLWKAVNLGLLNKHVIL